MSVSLAELDSRVFLGLSPAAEYLHLDDIHNAVVQRLNARTMQSRSSDINVLLGTTDPFIPDSIPYDVTALIGKGVPAWVETRANTINGIEYWHPVRNVNLNQFEDYRRTGALAVAFHGDETDSETAQPIQYLSFTYLPVNLCRIRFDRDGQRKALESDIILPDNLAELIVLEAQQSLIPRVKTAIAMRLRNDEEGRKVAPMLIQTLTETYLQNVVDIKPLDAQWKIWAFRDRNAQESFNLPTPNSSTMYANGRNRSWGGYFGGGY